MFNGLRSEHDAWTTCIKIILGLLEDSLYNGSIPNTKINFNDQDLLKNNGSTETLSVPDSPNNYSIKRKRSFNDTLQDRKIQKLSSSLANDIARSLSVSMDDVDMSPPAALPSSTAYTKQDPMPALRRISLSGTLNPQHIFTLDQWLEQQARQRNIPLQEHKQAFHDKQKTLRYHLDQLQRPDQSFNTLRDTLSKVLQIADELSGDHSLPFIEIFPEWTLYEAKINKLASYIQSVEDMSFSHTSMIPQTHDLLTDIKGLQHLLESKVKLYGDTLIQNGLEWKAMGLPVDEHLISATKNWIHYLCTGLLDALDTECKKVQNMANEMKDLVHTELGENLMASILNGLEFVADASSLIGYSSQKLVYDCDVLASIYGQWVSENLEQLSDKPDDSKGNSNSTKRFDIRFMQLMENMTRVLSTLYTLSDLEMIQKDIMHLSSTVAAVENLTSVLVELTVRAVGIIEIDRNTSKVSANIMLNPQTRFIYMGESLLAFANKIVEMAGREYVDGKRIKALHAYLEDLENSLENV